MALPPITLQFDGSLPLSEYFDVESATIPDPAGTDTRVHALVRAHGSTAVLVRCLTPAFDEWDGFDPTSSEYDLRLVKTILSDVSEKELRGLIGRGIDASRRCTLGEDIRVFPDRDGQGDLLLTVPDAEIVGISGSGSAWEITVARTGEPVAAAYPVAFHAGGVSLAGLNRDEYQTWAVVDVNRAVHPFANLRKTTLYLREVIGR